MADDIRIDVSDLIAKVNKMQDTEKILTPAMNRTKNTMITSTAKAITNRYKIQKGKVQSTISGRFSTSPPAIWLKLRRKRFSLIDFTRVSKRFAKATIIKGNSVKVTSAPGSGAPFTFIGRVNTKKARKKRGVRGALASAKATARGASGDGNQHVMRRKTQARTPVAVLKTLSTANMANEPSVQKDLYDRTFEVLLKNIESQIARFGG